MGEVIEEKLLSQMEDVLFQLFEEEDANLDFIQPDPSKGVTIEVIVSQPEEEDNLVLPFCELPEYAAGTKTFPDSVVKYLIILFNRINTDMAFDGEDIYPLTDDSWVDQIHNQVENWIIGGFCTLDESPAAKAAYDRQTSASYKVAEILFKRMLELL